MTVKQLAERMGVNVKALDIEVGKPCKFCVKMGGAERPCVDCAVIAMVKEKKA